MTYRVIVADNSPAVRKALELAMPETEFELLFFDNGPELAKALPDIGGDALLLGLSLPGMDGYRAAAQARALPELRQAAIIFLKGSFETFDPEKAAGLNYQEVVRKPFDSEALALRLKNLLDRKHDLLSFPEAAPGGDVAADGPRTERKAATADLTGLVRQEVADACSGMEDRLRTSIMAALSEGPAQGRKAGRARERSRS